MTTLPKKPDDIAHVSDALWLADDRKDEIVSGAIMGLLILFWWVL